MERLLCIKVASRGDLLLAGPAFRLLRRGRPSAHITLMVGRSCEDVARHLPFFDEIQTIDDYALFAGSWREKAGATIHLWRLLAGRKRPAAPSPPTPPIPTRPSEVLIFHRDWRYGLVARLAGVRVRRGLARSGDRHALTHAYQPPDDEHHVEQYLKLVAGEPSAISFGADDINLAGVWQFATGERESALALAATYGFQPADRRWLALGFGGGRNVKTRTRLKSWPLTHYQELADQVAGLGYPVVWVGDQEDARLLAPQVTGVNLAGRLTVGQTAAVLSACHRVVSNDSLILHLAEALRVPTIALFGPTDPRHYRPLGPGSVHLHSPDPLDCRPCHRDGWFPTCTRDHRCMKSLTVNAVLERIRTPS